MKPRILLSLVPVLGACVVGPDYRRPDLPTPTTWEAQDGHRVSAESADLTRWWASFGDPVLDALVERAARANLDLKQATARVREARAETGIARGARRPEVGNPGSAGRQRLSENGPFPVTDPESSLYRSGFDAHWELDLFGGLRRAEEAARAELEASIEDRRDVLVTLLAEVARAYVELRCNQRLETIVRRNVAAARATLELTRTRLVAGMATNLDVARAEALLAVTEAPLPRYEAAEHVAIHRLGLLLGEHPQALASELSVERPIPAPPDRILVGLPSELLQRRPDVRRAERRLAAATARIGAAVAERYPKVSLSGAFGLESTSLSSLHDAASRAWSIGPSVRWPLFAGGRIAAGIEAQDARAEQALHAYEETLLLALEDVENALVHYLREWDHRRALEATAEADRRAVSLSDELYRKGLTSFLDVLEAERGLYEAELLLAESEAASSLHVVSLYKALGGGWESEAEATAGPAAPGS